MKLAIALNHGTLVIEYVIVSKIINILYIIFKKNRQFTSINVISNQMFKHRYVLLNAFHGF